MEINYTNTYGDQLAQTRALLGGRRSVFAYYHYFWLFYWTVMATLGVFVSLASDQIFCACIFVAMFLFYAMAALPYSRVWQRSLERANRGRKAKQVRLRLDGKGLHETVEGTVESSAPWSAVRSFVLADDHLFIELAGELWANVPRARVAEGEAAFHEFVESLRAHHVAENPRSK